MLLVHESDASLHFSTLGNLLSSSTRARMFMGLTAMRSRASWLSTNSMCSQLMPSRLYSCCEQKPAQECPAYTLSSTSVSDMNQYKRVKDTVYTHLSDYYKCVTHTVSTLAEDNLHKFRHKQKEVCQIHSAHNCQK